MESVNITILAFLGVALVIIVVCAILDRIGEVVYKSTTLLWNFVAGALIIAATLTFLYHISGIKIGFSWA